MRRYTVEIRNAENLKYVKGLSGSLSGMARGLLLDGKVPTDEAATIPFAAAPTQDLTGITGGLFAFGPSSQRDGVHKLVIYAVLEKRREVVLHLRRDAAGARGSRSLRRPYSPRRTSSAQAAGQRRRLPARRRGLERNIHRHHSLTTLNQFVL